MQTAAANQDIALNAYNVLRQIPKGELDAARIERLRAELTQAGWRVDGLDTSLNLLHRMTHEISAKAWIQFCGTGELPPMKLSGQEMEACRGGSGFWEDVAAGAKAAASGDGYQGGKKSFGWWLGAVVTVMGGGGNQDSSAIRAGENVVF